MNEKIISFAWNSPVNAGKRLETKDELTDKAKKRQIEEKYCRSCSEKRDQSGHIWGDPL